MSSDEQQQPVQTVTSSNTTSDNNNDSNAPKLHQLADRWSLWYQPDIPWTPGQPEADTKDILRKVDTFSTVEEFWSVYNALPSVDKLTIGEQFMFFRGSIQPMWEDAALLKGGSVSVFTDHVDASDKFIQMFLAGMLGESFSAERLDGNKNLIAGIKYNAKNSKKGRQFKIEIWTTDYSKQRAVDSLVKEFAEKANIRQPLIFEKSFEDERKKNGK